jgi:hypothetical protein
MNRIVAGKLNLSPPIFARGLDMWSSTTGRPGAPTYLVSRLARIVPDHDFGPCLELFKTEPVQRLRYMGETPILPLTPLRIRARVKAVSGPLPSVRIAAWPGTIKSGHATGLVEHGSEHVLPAAGAALEIEAVVGRGPGADMRWSREAVYAHVGLDLTGPVGGRVRIESIRIGSA